MRVRVREIYRDREGDTETNTDRQTYRKSERE